MLEKKFVVGKGYLVGKKDGANVYMPKPSWDCGWYWGFGYLESYWRGTRHTHVDVICDESKKDWHTALTEYFDEMTLSEKELWLFCDYMRTFYTLRKTAEIYGEGYSHYTEKAKLPIIQNKLLADAINKVQLPALFKAIDELMTGEAE